MQSDHDRLVAIVSYGTLIGWVIALVLHQRQGSALGAFHLRQTLGLYLSAMLLGWVPLLGWVILLVLLLFWVLGLAGALRGERRAVPLVGNWYQTILAPLH